MKHQPENFGPPSPSHPFLVFLFLPICLVVYLVVVVLTMFGPMHFCGVCVHSGYVCVWVGGQASAIIIVPTWVVPFLSTVPAFFLDDVTRSPFITMTHHYDVTFSVYPSIYQGPGFKHRPTPRSTGARGGRLKPPRLPLKGSNLGGGNGGSGQ